MSEEQNNSTFDLDTLDNKTLQDYLTKSIEYIKQLQKNKNEIIVIADNEVRKRYELQSECNNVVSKLKNEIKNNKQYSINILFLNIALFILFVVLLFQYKKNVCI